VKPLQSDTRLLLLRCVTAGAAAIVITFGALEHQDTTVSSLPDDAAPDASGVAPSYRSLRGSRRGPNGNMYRGAVSELGESLPDVLDPVETSEAARAQAREKRRSSRAYEGAPPTIPHAVMQRAHDCVACHAEGAVIAGKTAPKMSHEAFPSCTQCHVPQADPRPIETPPPFVENEFVGLTGPGRGERAWPGAPPTISHGARMREDCSSCHGVSGKAGLRTPHPYQVSCTQCHAPSAALDQRAVKRTDP
jgi:nitrate reductase (cytochrome), electron transfer subunit